MLLFYSLILLKVIRLYYVKSVVPCVLPTSVRYVSLRMQARSHFTSIVLFLFLYDNVRHIVSDQSSRRPLLLYWLEIVYLYVIKKAQRRELNLIAFCPLFPPSRTLLLHKHARAHTLH
jgi:hypothetical protein